MAKPLTRVEFDIWRDFFKMALDGAAGTIGSDAGKVVAHADNIARAALELQLKTHNEVSEEEA
jgi:hypothetical protein